LKSGTFAENIILGKWGCVGKNKHAIGTGKLCADRCFYFLKQLIVGGVM
jgi:hypothetical protein